MNNDTNSLPTPMEIVISNFLSDLYNAFRFGLYEEMINLMEEIKNIIKSYIKIEQINMDVSMKHAEKGI